MRFLIYSLIALSPLPLASARPVWQWLWVCFIGIMVAAMLVRPSRTNHWRWPIEVIWPSCLIILFIFWGLFQALAPLGTHIQIGLDEIDTILVSKRVISINPDQTISVTFFFLAHFALFLCVFRYCSSRARVAELVLFVGITATIYAAYGFVVYISGNETILWYKKWAYHRSLTSTFVNRNSFAAYIGIGLLSLISYTNYWVGSRLSGGLKGKKLIRSVIGMMLGRGWMLLLALLLLMTSLILSQSRAGSVSVFFAILVLLLISRDRNSSLSKINSFWSWSFVVIVIAVALGLSGSLLGARLQVDTFLDQRFVAYPYMIDALLDHPIKGYGLGTFDDVFRMYRESNVTTWFDRAHNDYLELALTAGIPATVVFLSSGALILKSLVSCLKYGNQYKNFIALGLAAITQLGLHSFLDFSLQIPAVSYTWTALIAASLALAIRCRSEIIQ